MRRGHERQFTQAALCLGRREPQERELNLGEVLCTRALSRGTVTWGTLHVEYCAHVISSDHPEVPLKDNYYNHVYR